MALDRTNLDELKMAWFRDERLRLLEATESAWMANWYGIREERPYTADQLEYRQALRDLPASVSPSDIVEEEIPEKYYSPVTGDDLAKNNHELDSDSTAEPGIVPDSRPAHWAFHADDLFPAAPAGFERIPQNDDQLWNNPDGPGVSLHAVNFREIDYKTDKPTGKIINPDGINFDENGPITK